MFNFNYKANVSILRDSSKKAIVYTILHQMYQDMDHTTVHHHCGPRKITRSTINVYNTHNMQNYIHKKYIKSRNVMVKMAKNCIRRCVISTLV
jgi:membrane-bound inhibitor of C-type lysozyme